MKRLDLNLLLALDTLLSERNVTRAAHRLSISQPALSAQLARLRRVFGDPLLIPADSGRGMVPTARALELEQPLRVALKDLETAVRREPRFDARSAQRAFHIAATDGATATVGLPLMERVAVQAGPGVRLAFRIADSARVATQLAGGEVDLLIVVERAVPQSSKARRLYQESFVMVQRKGHPRGRRKPTLDAYCALPHVLVSPEGGGFVGAVDEELVKLGRSRNVVLSVQQFLVVPEILRGSDLVCALPRRLAARFAGTLDAFELPLRVPGFAFACAWHPRNHHDPANRWLREQVLAAAQV